MEILEQVASLVWGMPCMVLMLATGIFATVKTGGIQFRRLGTSIRHVRQSIRKPKQEGVSSFQAVCTALAATVGTGNLVGVAGAICLGGPGAIFWIWICGILGMVTKYAEVTLAVRYRISSDKGWIGGPMYIISQGIGRRWKWLASCYCLFGVIASFGVGNATQINAVISGLNSMLFGFGILPTKQGNLLFGVTLAILVYAALSGGARRIGSAAEKLIPFVSCAYLLLCAGVLIWRWRYLDDAFRMIFQGAFSPNAVTGGILGSAFQAMKVGCARGVFTNEAGMGTASIAHASAETDFPARQGLFGIVEVFLDTLVICTLTALVILVSGVPISYGFDSGGDLTTRAFSALYGQGASIFLAVALCCFAFATVLGWGLYGGRCAEFLLRRDIWKGYAVAQSIAVLLGSCLNTQTLWLFAETANGLMAIPNLLILAVLAPEVCRLTIEYKEKTGRKLAGGGKLCKFPSTQTAANLLLCESSILWRWQRKKKERRSIT